MRWAPLHPRQLLALGLLVFGLALLITLATAPDLSTLDFSIGSSSSSGAGAPTPPAAEPQWVKEPFAPPLDTLAGG